MHNWIGNHFKLVFGGIFLIVGIPFLIVSIVSAINTRQLLSVASKAPGRVIKVISSRDSDGDRMYHPLIEYRSLSGEEKTWEPSTRSTPPEFEVNDEVELLIDPGQPNRIEINNFRNLWMFSVGFGISGFLSCIVGVIAVVLHLKQQSDRAWLKSHGRVIEAQYSRLVGSDVVVNGRSGWRLLCQWNNPGDNKVYTFLSDNLWFDPTAFLTQNQSIMVTIDPANPVKYMVDVSFLPQSAN